MKKREADLLHLFHRELCERGADPIPGGVRGALVSRGSVAGPTFRTSLPSLPLSFPPSLGREDKKSRDGVDTRRLQLRTLSRWTGRGGRNSNEFFDQKIGPNFGPKTGPIEMTLEKGAETGPSLLKCRPRAGRSSLPRLLFD